MISQTFLFYMHLYICAFISNNTLLSLQTNYILIHEYKMAEASAHYKQMKNFMRTECAVFCIEYGKL